MAEKYVYNIDIWGKRLGRKSISVDKFVSSVQR